MRKENNIKGNKAICYIQCKGCGAIIPLNIQYCPICGIEVRLKKEEDVPDIMLNLFAFLFPVLGIYMFFDLRKRLPNKAEEIGIFAMLGIISVAIFCAIIFFWCWNHNNL